MPTRLLYHRFPPPNPLPTSPFQEVISSIAAPGILRITCPYIGVDYFETIISGVDSWWLITDVNEWMASHSMTDRTPIVGFVRRHQDRVRDLPGLHAKAVIGESAAYLGSLNLTKTAHQRRIEAGVYIEGPQVEELATWFDELWDASRSVSLRELATRVKSLPDRSYSSSQAVSASSVQTARLNLPSALVSPLPADRERRQPQEGLPPVRIGSPYHKALAALSDAGSDGMTRAELGRALGHGRGKPRGDSTKVGAYAGYNKQFEVNDRDAHRLNLFSRGYVEIARDGSRYWITEAGHSALRRISQSNS